LFPQYSRYSTQCTEATKLYQEIARKKRFKLNGIVIGFIERTAAFVTSTIISYNNGTIERKYDTIQVSLSDEILSN
jgi:hypothetical protein